MSQDSAEAPMDESKVLRRLEQRREQHQKARESAKEVFRKLREQRLKQGSAGTLPPGSAMVRKKNAPPSLSVMASGTGAEERPEQDSDSNTNRCAVRLERLKDILGNVARAKESVDLIVEGGVVRNRRSATEQKEEAIVEETEEPVHVEEDELTNTIDRWLDKCFGNITVRGETRRNKERRTVTLRAEDCKEEDEDGAKEAGREEGKHSDGEGKEGERGGVGGIRRRTPMRDDSQCDHSVDEIHDDDMAGLQYMLAKELMSSNTGEDEDATD